VRGGVESDVDIQTRYPGSANSRYSVERRGGRWKGKAPITKPIIPRYRWGSFNPFARHCRHRGFSDVESFFFELSLRESFRRNFLSSLSILRLQTIHVYDRWIVMADRPTRCELSRIVVIQMSIQYTWHNGTIVH